MKVFIQKLIKPTQESENPIILKILESLHIAASYLNKRGKWIIPSLKIGLGLILLAILILSIEHQTATVSNYAFDQNKRTSIILNEITDLKDQVKSLSVNSKYADKYKAITAGLDFLQHSIPELAKSSDIQKMSNQLASMKDDVDSQMFDLKKAVANSSDVKQYVNAKVLPFHVISIDVISQQPFVSIEYATHITPLAVGDTVAGWQITSADYDAAQVEFKNDHDQYVKVSL